MEYLNHNKLTEYKYDDLQVFYIEFKIDNNYYFGTESIANNAVEAFIKASEIAYNFNNKKPIKLSAIAIKNSLENHQKELNLLKID